MVGFRMKYYRRIICLGRSQKIQSEKEDKIWRENMSTSCIAFLLTDFNGMSTRLGLSYVKSLGNHVHHINQTHPLGQDVTQGQFLSGV